MHKWFLFQKRRFCSCWKKIAKGKNADVAILEQVLHENGSVSHLIEVLVANRMCGLAYVVLKDKETLSLLNREYRSMLEAVYWYGRERNKLSGSSDKCMDAAFVIKAGDVGRILIELEKRS